MSKVLTKLRFTKTWRHTEIEPASLLAESKKIPDTHPTDSHNETGSARNAGVLNLRVVTLCGLDTANIRRLLPLSQPAKRDANYSVRTKAVLILQQSLAWEIS